MKSGVLERICDALDVKMDFFYEGTKYLNVSSSSDNSPGLNHQDEQPTEDMFDYVKDKEISYLRGQIKVLEKINEKLLNMTQTVSQNVCVSRDHIIMILYVCIRNTQVVRNAFLIFICKDKQKLIKI